jgi:hypothetical protein
MRGGIPIRTSKRTYAESYLDYKNNIFIFIEDKDQNTRKIMLELIQRAIDKNIKIDRLHSMGGRTEVLEAFERRNINRTEIYIIDGDLYMLFENHNFQKGLVVFDRYCIENYLLDVNALNELLYQEALTINDKEKLIQNFDYLKWFEKQNVLLVKLFKMYAIEKFNNLGIETVSFSINLLREKEGKNILCSCDETLINKRIKDLENAIIDKVGNEKFISDETFIENQINNRNADILVSAKDYILPLIFDRLKKYANNKLIHNESLKFRLAQMINIEPFKENLKKHLEVR